MANEKAEFSGNNVNYYLVEVKDPKRLDPYTAECEDIIEALNMTFAEGNAFKAIWRSCAARTLGKRKVGEDPHGIYDAEKVSYYAKRMVAMRNRLKNEQNPETVEYVPPFINFEPLFPSEAVTKDTATMILKPILDWTKPSAFGPCVHCFGSIRCGHKIQPGERCDQSFDYCNSIGNALNFGGAPTFDSNQP